MHGGTIKKRYVTICQRDCGQTKISVRIESDWQISDIGNWGNYFVFVQLFCFEVKWSGVTVKFLGTKVPCTLGWPYTEGTSLYCDCFICCVSLNVVVLTCFVMCGWVYVCVFWQLCGCFGNMCTCIYCVLYCLYCVLYCFFMYIYAYFFCLY